MFDNQLIFQLIVINNEISFVNMSNFNNQTFVFVNRFFLYLTFSHFFYDQFLHVLLFQTQFSYIIDIRMFINNQLKTTKFITLNSINEILLLKKINCFRNIRLISKI